MSRVPKFNSLKYEVFRFQARRLAYQMFASDPECIAAGIDTRQVRFEPIDHCAIAATEHWGARATLYPWEEVRKWKRTDLKGFDLALWFGPELCGLCYATPRKSRICIKIILLEGRGDKTHPLKGLVASLSLSAVDFYARMLKCKEIEAQDPAKGAIALYKELGFDFGDDGRLVISVAGH
ncbi:N-acetyltransferase [Pseudomonas sp. MWU12-2323]|nr:N-acetyltransferase [Pseudomonas sp. MWU12-2323]